MIKLVSHPRLEHGYRIRADHFPELMRRKSAQRNGERAKQRRNGKKIFIHMISPFVVHPRPPGPSQFFLHIPPPSQFFLHPIRFGPILEQ